MMHTHHILLNRTHDTVLRFLPPYLITRDHVDQVITALDDAPRVPNQATITRVSNTTLSSRPLSSSSYQPAFLIEPVKNVFHLSPGT